MPRKTILMKSWNEDERLRRLLPYWRNAVKQSIPSCFYVWEEMEGARQYLKKSLYFPSVLVTISVDRESQQVTDSSPWQPLWLSQQSALKTRGTGKRRTARHSGFFESDKMREMMRESRAFMNCTRPRGNEQHSSERPSLSMSIKDRDAEKHTAGSILK